VDAGGLGSDEQRLADLPVGPPLGNQSEYLGLTLGETERGGRRRRGLRFRSRVDRFFEAEAAAPGKQFDLTM
jgi:hypothetical protein